MKPRFHSFLSSFLAGALVVGASVSAFAITSSMTIDVYPINIQVNGETFQPTDVTGREVPVFAYEGTTYAPLRALAEAYGLEVGYDAEANMAIVNDPDVKPEQPATPDTTTPDVDYSGLSDEDRAYQEWKSKWKVSEVDLKWIPDKPEYGGVRLNKATMCLYRVDYCGPEWSYSNYPVITDQVEFYKSKLKADVALYAPQLLSELQKTGKDTVAMFFFGDANGNEIVLRADGTIVSN